jgi:mono/diheme cytochrome c family protein
MCKAREGVTEVHRASFGKVKGIMKIVYLKRVGTAIGVATMLTLIFLVSGAAQTEVKFVDAASYYTDGKCVVCHGQKAEKKFNAELKDEELLEIVMKGKKPEKPPNMPAYEAKGLTADQAKAMVAYMKSIK